MKTIQVIRVDSDSLSFERVKHWKLVVVFCGIMFFLFLSSFISAKSNTTTFLKNETEITYKRDADFSQDKLITEMKRLKIQHPHIAFAQMLIETNYFKHPRFTKMSNIAGLRRAGSRATTASGYDDNGFAEFTDWKQSLLDYTLLQTGFARGLTEEQYYQWLKNYTHEDNYITLVKQIVKQRKLKERFKNE